MKLLIHWPIKLEEEKRYITDVLLGVFLGIEYEIKFLEIPHIEIIGLDKKVILPDMFFSRNKDKWLEKESIALATDKCWKPVNPDFVKILLEPVLPFLYYNNSSRCDFSEDTNGEIRFEGDIFGSCFYLLTRYEEYLSDDLDRFERYKFTSSILYKENILHRPLVNEYLEVLWILLLKINPNLKRKSREFQLVVTHDVDSPYLYLYKTPWRFFKSLVSSQLQQISIKKLFHSIYLYISSKVSSGKRDLHNTFDYILEESEKRNLQSRFYFICDHTNLSYDGEYKLYFSQIKILLNSIIKRGHFLGVHGSFSSCKNLLQIEKEAKIFKESLKDIDPNLNDLHNRQHYLKFSFPETIRFLEEVGYSSDSTLGFAERPGFRCGTCYEYPLFDLKKRKQLKLVESPLIAMESSVIDKRYMGLGYSSEALMTFLSLKNTVKKYNGNYVLLWHNDRFKYPEERKLYENVLDG